MKKIILLSGILLMGAVLLACAPKIEKPALPEALAPKSPASAKEGWSEQSIGLRKTEEAKWEKLVREAKKEGRVVVYSSLGREQTIPLVDAFRKSFDLPLEFVAGRGEEMSRKIMAERAAGLYLIDAYVGGSTTIYTVFKSQGFLIPLEPELVFPDVRDPNTYWRKKLPFSDVEGKYVFTFIATVTGAYAAINTNFVRKDELLSYYDLLAPKFKGKVVLQDPTVPGKGNNWYMTVMAAGKTLDADYMKSLARQELFLARDRRQQIEFLARGKYWVSIANQSSMIKEFIDLGSPIVEIKLKEDIDKVAPGSGNMVLMDKAPHPAAAKVFVNWLLTKEVQTLWARVSDDQSARVDVPTDHLSLIRDPRVTYFQEDEKFAIEGLKYGEQAREIFGHLLK